ncbi:MAG: DUF3782 domain-containing protein [Methanospirillaceae archaeon]|nr:DUF3782 domain-containing protein [Methanospirillaceae archaeon]
MSSITDVIRHFPQDLQDPMIQFWEVVKDELGVKREDFTELKNIVSELAQAQKNTELKVEELVQAQKNTELKVEELAQAQKELTQAQKNTERSLQRLSDTIDFKLGGLGRRWGLDSERSFRNGLAEILSDTGYQVINYLKRDDEGMVFGYPSDIEIDVIILGDRTLVIEIKSSVSTSDVYIFLKKAHFYATVSGQPVDKLLMITPFIDDTARDIAEEYKITICDSISKLDASIRKDL